RLLTRARHGSLRGQAFAVSSVSVTGTCGVGTEISRPVEVVLIDEKGQNVAGGSAHAQLRPLILMLSLEELIVAVLAGWPARPPPSTMIAFPDVCGIAILSVACAGEPGSGCTLTLTTEPGVAVTELPGDC